MPAARRARRMLRAGGHHKLLCCAAVCASTLASFDADAAITSTFTPIPSTSAAPSPLTFSLNTDSVSWQLTLQNSSSSQTITVPATVPGQATLDLLFAGVIPEPYLDFNDVVLRWIPNTSALYTATFSVPPEIAGKAVVELVLEGIDTVADVVFDGQTLASTTNQFHTHRIPLPSLSSSSSSSSPHTLLVNISSPIQSAFSAAEACHSITPEFCPTANADNDLNGIPHVNYIRKTPCSFGWDFAPSFAPSGIWRPVYLLAYDEAAIVDVTSSTALVSAFPDLSAWSLSLTAWVRSSGRSGDGGGGTLSVVVDGVGGGGSASVSTGPLPGGTEDVPISITLPSVTGVSPWWPNGLGGGQQQQYNCTVTLTSGEGEVSVYTFLLAFRTTELLQPPTNDGGNLFYFAVNSVPLYLKGANFVPFDSFDARVTDAKLEGMFASFVESNFNVVRVWGGGSYPRTSFFQLAQQYGILIWQEAMYACAGYPATNAFLASAAKEVQDNVKRIAKYSLLAWGGNNENEWLQSKIGQPSEIFYQMLNFGSVLSSFQSLDPARPALPSSPSNGNETAARSTSPNPNSPERGDMHIYNYAGNCWDAENSYPRPRLASEFGWQSYSSFPTMATYLSPSQWFYWSDGMRSRDHHQSQPQWLILYKNVGENWKIPGPQPPNSTASSGGTRDPMARHQRLRGRALALATDARSRNATTLYPTRRPDGTLELPTDALGFYHVAELAGELAGGGGGAADISNATIFADTLWMTQVAQAQCVKVEAEKYRAIQSECGGGLGGCTMGSLYWMANDLWPAATKGSLEYNLRWKVLQHYAQRTYKPFVVSAFAQLYGPPSNRTFTVSVSNQQPALLRNVSTIPYGCVLFRMWSWSKGGVAGAFSVPFSLATGFGGNSSVWVSTLADVLSRGGCSDAADCVLTFAAFNLSSFSSCPASFPSSPSPAAVLLDENHLFLSPLTNVTTMQDPQLSITNVSSAPEIGDGAFLVTYEVGVLPGPLVWLQSTYAGHVDGENGLLVTSSPRTVTYRVEPSQVSNSSAITPGQLAASLSIWSLYDVADYRSR